MNKAVDVFTNIILTLVGIAFLSVPALYAYYEIYWLMIASYVMYGTLTFNSIIYLFGCINCDKSIATVIVAELEATKTWYSNVFPLMLVIICTVAIIYKSMFILSIVILAPLLLNKLSRIILKHKAKLDASPSTS